MLTHMKQNSGNIVLYIFELVLGILLWIDPIKFTNGIIILVGVALLVLGIVWLARYFRLNVIQAMAEHDLSKGLISAGLGLFCILRSEWFIDTFPILTILYGVAMLVVAITKIQTTVNLLRLKNSGWGISAISAVLTLLFAIIILADPFSTMEVLWRFIAVILIVEALLDIVALFICGYKAKKL